METVAYLHLSNGQTPPSLEGLDPFKAVLFIEQTTEDIWRTTVAEWLVRSGCLYLMSWGDDCEDWHDRVDWANISSFEGKEIPDEAFVMTTWHSDEPLSEVFWFATHAAHHPTVTLAHTLIVHVSAAERGAEVLRAFWDAQEPDK